MLNASPSGMQAMLTTPQLIMMRITSMSIWLLYVQYDTFRTAYCNALLKLVQNHQHIATVLVYDAAGLNNSEIVLISAREANRTKFQADSEIKARTDVAPITHSLTW